MKAYSLWKTKTPFQSGCLRLWFSCCRLVTDWWPIIRVLRVIRVLFSFSKLAKFAGCFFVEGLLLVKKSPSGKLNLVTPSNQNHLDHFISHQKKLQNLWKTQKKQHAHAPSLLPEFCRSRFSEFLHIGFGWYVHAWRVLQ